MSILLSRKHLLGRAAVATGGVIVAGGVVASAAGAPGELRAYQLDPDCCHGCNACRKHALNTLFASAAAADLFRAHVYCRCAVVEGPLLPHDTWVALFGLPDLIARQSVDRRTAWVSDVLAAASAPLPDATPPTPPTPPAPPTPPTHPPAPSSSSAPPSGSGGQGVDAATAPPAGIVATPRRLAAPFAAQLAVRGIRIGKAQRALLLRFKLSTPSTLQVRLVGLQGRSLVLRNYQAGAGRSLHTFRVPNGVHPGRYRVAVTVRTAGGSTSTLQRTVLIS